VTACLWWVRHGPTHARGMVGWTDLPADLSDRGALSRLAAALPPDAPIVSSDLRRAADTAAALSGDRARLPPDPRLREMHFGAWEMRRHDEIEAETPDLIRAFWDRPGEVCPPDGESWQRMARRVSDAADELAATGGDVIVVAHFGPILSQVQRARPQSGFSQTVAPLSLTRMVRRADGWRATLVDHRP